MEQVVDNVPSSFPAPAPRPVLNTTPQEQPSNGAMAGAGVTASGDHALPAASVSSNGEASNGLTTPALDTSAVTTTEISEAAAVPSTTPSIVSGTSTELVTKAAPEAGGVTTPDAAKPSENDVPAPVAGENKLGTEQPRRKRTRRGGWDTPAVVVPTVPVLPVNPLQELQRKLAEEQVAAAMGQAPPVTSVSAGAAALSLTMSGISPPTVKAPPPPPPAQENPRRIYVGSLHYDLKESDVMAIFAAFGPVRSVEMSHDPATGRHKGFCFIEFSEVGGADGALAAMNGFELAGRPIKVGKPHMAPASALAPANDGVSAAAMQLPGMAAFMAQRSAAAAAAATLAGGGAGTSVAAAQLKAAMTTSTAPPQTKIYVGNVEPHITTEMIKNVFAPFGMVVGAEMVADPNNPGHHKGFGFIQYAQESVAKTAMETMANFELAGRCLRVAWAQDQSKPAMSVLPPGLSAAAAAAQAAAAAAKAAGGAAAAAVAARMTASGQLQAVLGNAVGAGNGNAAGGPTNVVGVAGSAGTNPAVLNAPNTAAAHRVELMKRISEARKLGSVSAAVAAVGPVSKCVYFANMMIPEDAEDEDTRAEIFEEAETCGTVEKFYVHQQRTASGVVVAVRVFVVYSDVTEAAVAIRKMNGRFFAGRQVRASTYDLAQFSNGVMDA